MSVTGIGDHILVLLVRKKNVCYGKHAKRNGKSRTWLESASSVASGPLIWALRTNAQSVNATFASLTVVEARNIDRFGARLLGREGTAPVVPHYTSGVGVKTTRDVKAVYSDAVTNQTG